MASADPEKPTTTTQEAPAATEAAQFQTEMHEAGAPAFPVGDAASASPPTGWMHRRLRVGPITLPAYASPPTQLVLVSIVCFLCPGMFNALSGIGGGGQVDATVANNASTALYSCFAIVGFFAGTIVNRVGIKLTLSFGGMGYTIYAISFLTYSHAFNNGFVIFAGAFLGVCAGCLWAAQGTIMMSYPNEGEKGRYISWFWMIFNLGAVYDLLLPRSIILPLLRPLTPPSICLFIVPFALC